MGSYHTQKAFMEQNQQKAGIENLPNSYSGKYVFKVEVKAAKRAFRNAWKNPEVKKEIIRAV
jgi:hypothetical protein